MCIKDFGEIWKYMKEQDEKEMTNQYEKRKRKKKKIIIMIKETEI